MVTKPFGTQIPVYDKLFEIGYDLLNSEHSCCKKCILLYGQIGVGKRAIAQEVARGLNILFASIDISCSGEIGKKVREEMILLSQGIENSDEPVVMLYLDSFDQLSEECRSTVLQMIQRGAFIDENGVYNFPCALFIVAGLNVNAEAITIRLDSAICTEFDERVPVNIQEDMASIFCIASNMTQRIMPGKKLAQDTALYIQSVLQDNEGFNCMERWLEFIALHFSSTEPISEEMLRDAMHEDLKWLLAKMRFRGTKPQYSDAIRWINQFPIALRDLAFVILKNIAHRYFIDDHKYYGAINKIVSSTNTNGYKKLVFCRWQDEGRSEPRISHDLSKAFRAKPAFEIDLRRPLSQWPTISNNEEMLIVISDDFVCTGGTFIDALFGQKQRIADIAMHYQKSYILLCAIAGFQKSVSRVVSLFSEYEFSRRIKIIVPILFKDEDRCFHENSNILKKSTQRTRLKAFCEDFASNINIPWIKEHPLGYMNSQTIVVYHYGTPNNTLPIIWADVDDRWKPLFPR